MTVTNVAIFVLSLAILSTRLAPPTAQDVQDRLGNYEKMLIGVQEENMRLSIRIRALEQKERQVRLVCTDGGPCIAQGIEP